MVSCENGHLGDFPWKKWLTLHGNKSSSCDNNKIKLLQNKADSSQRSDFKCENVKLSIIGEKSLKEMHLKVFSALGDTLTSEVTNPETCNEKVKLLLKGK